ncbi:MAG: glycoside hydrolase family 13 protein, partial [Oscillospiraceae bacterium]|nr:glycoside hydrolase family 13 protein [Oscillospiraceae bacterium]
MLIFDSRNERYKSKFGAIADGECITLRLLLPCGGHICCTGAGMLLCRDGEEYKRYDFKATEEYDQDCAWWELDFSIDQPGLYWYYFEFSTPHKTFKLYNDGAGKGTLSDDMNTWQLTVYSKNFKTPDWLAGGVIYHIFPDRFFKSGEPKRNVPDDRVIRSPWGGTPHWEPDAHGKILNNDYFGGDLKGIEQKLDYLKSLGVTCIYMTPIFEAHSNHRYNTADYLNVDPSLGTAYDFKSLCDAAKKLDIHIILDGVFSHTGDDSIYFNKHNRYSSIGAYNSRESKYFDWFKFSNWPHEYESWWNFSTLPEVCEDNPSYLDFITGEDGVAATWLKAGARGWRLDVADELPDIFIDSLRMRAKSIDPEALILGEVWEDASNKISYEKRRKYLLGSQ